MPVLFPDPSTLQVAVMILALYVSFSSVLGKLKNKRATLSEMQYYGELGGFLGKVFVPLGRCLCVSCSGGCVCVVEAL